MLKIISSSLSLLFVSVVFIAGCKNNYQYDYSKVLTINRDDCGLQIVLPLRKLLLVRLAEDVSNGEIWEIERFDSKFLKPLKNDYDSKNKERLFYFSALQEGSCELVFRQQKLWQQDKIEFSQTNLNKIFFRVIIKNRR